MHRCICDDGSYPALQECHACCKGVLHCPLCPTFTSSNRTKIEAHMHFHMERGVQFRVGVHRKNRVFCGIMRLSLRCLHFCPGRCHFRCFLTLIPKRLKQLWCYCNMVLKSLSFNTLTSSDVVMDSVLEPVFWLVDRLTRWFGVAFVVLTVVLTGSVVVIAYFYLLPMIIHTYPPGWVVWHLCYGHWNLVMIVFHYYKATRTSPGHPPQAKTSITAVSVCKKCIMPKPPRTHHCGICNCCILKMDHHCPWLNNCVGHFNHRYFFSFCLFMTLGCMYCSISGRDMFLDAYHAIEHFKRVEQEGVPVTAGDWLIGVLPSGLVLQQSSHHKQPPTLTFREKMFYKSIIYMWVLTSTVALALGSLTLWHALLISQGETSIERHINKKERRRMEKRGKVFQNPFNYGRINNWKVFFGVEKRSHWLTRVLLPSSHPSHGDGLTWEWHKREVISV